MEAPSLRLSRQLFILTLVLGALLSGAPEMGHVALAGSAFARPDSSPAIYEGEPAFTTEVHLPDTGQTRCFDGSKEIPCPGPTAPYYGQDAQYQGASPSYRGNGDDTVSDLNTGLMWQQGDVHNDWGFGWEEAAAYCNDLTLAEYTDWRLPSRRELISLIDYGRSNPAIDTRYFANCYPDKYWSNTVTAIGPSSAWEVNFSYGGAYADGKVYALNVRCVRNEW